MTAAVLELCAPVIRACLYRKTGNAVELVDAGDMHNQQHITLAGYEKKPSRLSMNWLPVALPVKRIYPQ